MEHVVQFGVGIDDVAIRKYVEENASRQIIEELRDDVLSKLFESRYYGSKVDPTTDALSDFAIECFVKIIEDNKQEIINRAVLELANRLSRTKKVKEIISRLEELS